MPPSRRLDSARCGQGTTITDKDSVHAGHDYLPHAGLGRGQLVWHRFGRRARPQRGADNAGHRHCADAVRVDAPAREAAKVARHGDGVDQAHFRSRCISIDRDGGPAIARRPEWWSTYEALRGYLYEGLT